MQVVISLYLVLPYYSHIGFLKHVIEDEFLREGPKIAFTLKLPTYYIGVTYGRYK